MDRHPAPNIQGFLRTVWYYWAALMSGIFTVPFTIAAILVSSAYGRGIFGTMAGLAFLLTAYRIWADERRQLVKLEQHLAPRLIVEFDPRKPKFVHPTDTRQLQDALCASACASHLPSSEGLQSPSAKNLAVGWQAICHAV